MKAWIEVQNHPDYYDTYFRDPDSNKLCIRCHESVPDPTLTVATGSNRFAAAGCLP